MTLLELRKQYGLSQTQASQAVGVPLRTYIRYETNEDYGNALKRDAMAEKLSKRFEITETHGKLTVEEIKRTASRVFAEEYEGKIEFCYLFGSYAKGYATGKSDVDLCVSTSLTGLEFFGLVEKLRNGLHKKVDLIRWSDLEKNFDLVHEIIKDGIKIF